MPVKKESSQTAPSPKRLLRDTKNANLAGVASGIANYLDIDPTVIRLLFVIFTVIGGFGLIVYILLWLVIPTNASSDNDYIKDNAAELKAKAEDFAKDFRSNTGNRPTLGIILLCVGGFFLLKNIGVLSWVDMDTLWPVLLIVVGIMALKRNK